MQEAGLAEKTAFVSAVATIRVTRLGSVMLNVWPTSEILVTSQGWQLSCLPAGAPARSLHAVKTTASATGQEFRVGKNANALIAETANLTTIEMT